MIAITAHRAEMHKPQAEVLQKIGCLHVNLFIDQLCNYMSTNKPPILEIRIQQSPISKTKMNVM